MTKNGTEDSRPGSPGAREGWVGTPAAFDPAAASGRRRCQAAPATAMGMAAWSGGAASCCICVAGPGCPIPAAQKGPVGVGSRRKHTRATRRYLQIMTSVVTVVVQREQSRASSRRWHARVAVQWTGRRCGCGGGGHGGGGGGGCSHGGGGQGGVAGTEQERRGGEDAGEGDQTRRCSKLCTYFI